MPSCSRVLFCLLALACLGGCGPADGEEGADCIFEGSWWSGHYRCTSGLVCNSARSPKVCEKPHTNGLGAPCSEDANCLVSLYCSVGPLRTCTARSKEGEPCPSGIECEPGLVCVKGPSGIRCETP